MFILVPNCTQNHVIIYTNLLNSAVVTGNKSQNHILCRLSNENRKITPTLQKICRYPYCLLVVSHNHDNLKLVRPIFSWIAERSGYWISTSISPEMWLGVFPVILCSYPESSGSLASGWLPGETLGNWNFITTGFVW